MKLVRINLPTVARRDFRVAAIDGAVELLAQPDDPFAARLIITRLVEGEQAGWLDEVPVTIFDRLCADLFEREFSPDVECRSDCQTCCEPFLFQFDLSELIAGQDQVAYRLGLSPDEDGYWQVDGGLSLRPPSMGDLDRNLAPEALSRMLVRSGDPDDPRVDALLNDAAPLLTVPIATACPHCGEAQEVGFDMAGYLVASIAAEHPFLIRETHLLASRYGWTHESIMALPRKDRRAYAALIESERSAALARRPA